jgi:adenylate kinase family enzyme
MRRVSVVGSGGAGKSTFARRLAALLDAPHLEVDAVHHGPNWSPRPSAEIRAAVAEFCEADRWVVDGNYAAMGVQRIVWSVADTVVWLDHSRVRLTARVAARSVRRRAHGEELWNGNREPWTVFWPFNKEESVIRQTWEGAPRSRRRYVEAMADPANASLRFVRLRGFAEANAFLARIDAADLGIPPPD